MKQKIFDSSFTSKLKVPKINQLANTVQIKLAASGKSASLKEIEEMIKKEGGDLKTSILLQTVNFYAPLIYDDLRKVKSASEEGKKEYVVYSHLGYEELTKEEYLNFINQDKEDYVLWINEIRQEFLIHDNSKSVNPISKKALIMLIKGRGKIISYQTLFEALSRSAQSDEYTGWDKDNRINKEYINKVQRWFSDLRRDTGLSKEEWEKIVINVPINKKYKIYGYKFFPEKGKKYCLIDHLP